MNYIRHEIGPGEAYFVEGHNLGRGQTEYRGVTFD